MMTADGRPLTAVKHKLGGFAITADGRPLTARRYSLDGLCGGLLSAVCGPSPL